MVEKYKFLRAAATIFRVIGWIILVVGVLGSILAAASVGVLGGFFSDTGYSGGIIGAVVIAVLGILYSVIIWISLLAAAELMYVFMDIEKNTRETALRLRPVDTRPVETRPATVPPPSP